MFAYVIVHFITDAYILYMSCWMATLLHIYTSSYYIKMLLNFPQDECYKLTKLMTIEPTSIRCQSWCFSPK